MLGCNNTLVNTCVSSYSEIIELSFCRLDIHIWASSFADAYVSDFVFWLFVYEFSSSRFHMTQLCKLDVCVCSWVFFNYVHYLCVLFIFAGVLGTMCFFISTYTMSLLNQLAMMIRDDLWKPRDISNNCYKSLSLVMTVVLVGVRNVLIWAWEGSIVR